MQSVPIIRLDYVSLIRDGNRILHDIELCIDHGQPWAIIGQNGSGNTSLISIKNVYHQLSKGKACAGGKNFGSTGNYRDFKDVQLLRRGIVKKIAGHELIEIYAPDKSRFSFLKSPYAAHKTNSAVDIYHGSFGSEAVSPVDGKIIDIRSFDTPTPFKNIDSKEYLIAIKQGNHVIKILHIKPDVLSDRYKLCW
jgi:ABC-type cobalamin/Fe3+-siderophores transport system ATPase subunit